FVLHVVVRGGIGPRSLRNLLPKHPARRPDPLAGGYLDTCLDAAVLGGDAALRGDARRGLSVFLLQRGDDQVAVPVQGGVVTALGVVLQFFVSPAVITGLVVPHGRGGCLARFPL